MKGILLLSNNCEDLEAVGTLALLRRAGFDVKTVTFNDDLVVKGAYKTTLIADLSAKNIDVKDYDFLVIPGGKYVSEVIETDKDISNLILKFNEKDKLIAAICAAPMFLGKEGLLENKNYTAFPSTESDTYKGHYRKNKKSVTDGNIITARSAGAVVEFSYEITKKLKGEIYAKKLVRSIYY